MTTRSPTDNPVRTGHDIDVEVRIDFQGRQDGDIQTVNHGPFGQWVSIHASVDFVVVCIATKGHCRWVVKVLYVDDFLNEAFF